jgi:N-acetylglutamate synthase-like GNAT family acetyltransferase
MSRDGRLLGCGQIKVHSGGVLELASIAVVPEERHKGLASEIIKQLIDSTTDDLYLTCRARLKSFYRAFGFENCPTPNLLPRYFANLLTLGRILLRLKIIKQPMLVMRSKQK